MLAKPRRIRKAAETEVPMIPPMRPKLSNRSLIAAAVAATTMDVMMTILRGNETRRDSEPCSFLSVGLLLLLNDAHVECPSEKNIPTVTGRCPAATRRRVIRSIAFIFNNELHFGTIRSDMTERIMGNSARVGVAHRDVIGIKRMSEPKGIRQDGSGCQRTVSRPNHPSIAWPATDRIDSLGDEFLA